MSYTHSRSPCGERGLKLTSTPHQASFPRPAPFETPPAPARAGADVPPRVVHLAGNLLERLKQQIPPEKHRVIPPVGQFAQLRRDVALLVHQAVNIPVDFGFQVNDFRHRVRQTIRRAAAPGYAVFPQDGRDARRHVLQSRRVRQLAGDPLVEKTHLRQILFRPHVRPSRIACQHRQPPFRFFGGTFGGFSASSTVSGGFFGAFSGISDIFGGFSPATRWASSR